MLCSFCHKVCKNENSLRNHQRLCSDNPNKQQSNIETYKTLNSIPWNKNKTGVQTAWNKNLRGIRGTPHTEETKKKISEQKKALYASGWESKAGRCKKYDYVSPIAGSIKVDGTWELIFCRFADANNLQWNRNKKRFSYIKPNGSKSTYQPDFYVADWGSYIEVKGYETDLDRCKWSQFSEKLIIYRKHDIGKMDEWLKSAPC